MEVGNNILVKFYTYNNTVKYDTYEGSFIVFNNNSLITKVPLPTLLFTGVKFEVNYSVKIVCRDADNIIVQHSFWDSWLYVEPKQVDDFIGTISFFPQEDNKIVEEFYGNFLEVVNESI